MGAGRKGGEKLRVTSHNRVSVIVKDGLKYDPTGFVSTPVAEEVFRSFT